METTEKKLTSLFLTGAMVLSMFTVGLGGFSSTVGANVPGGNSSGLSGLNADDTRDVERGSNQIAEIADVNFTSAGNVTHVNVTLNSSLVSTSVGNGVFDSQGIEPSDVNWVEVRLINESASEGFTPFVTIRKDDFDDKFEIFNFTNTHSDGGDCIDRIQIVAEWSSDASNGDMIDAGLRVRDDRDGTVWPGSFYNTVNNQTFNDTKPARISAEVNSFERGSVEDAKVVFKDAETGVNVTDEVFLTDENGNTNAIKVPYGRYNARAEKELYEFDKSGTVTVNSESPNARITVTLDAIRIPASLKVVDVDPEDGTAWADGKDTITYTVRVLDTEGFGLRGVEVKSRTNSSTVYYTSTDDVTATNTTNGDGRTTFSIYSYQPQDVTVYFEVSSNASISASTESLSEEKPTISYSLRDVSHTKAEVGEKVMVEASAENTGDDNRSYNATLQIDGDAVDYKTGNLEPGKAENFSFTRTFGQPGIYDLSINGLTSRTIEIVEDRPNLGLSVETNQTTNKVEMNITVSNVLTTEAKEVTATLEGISPEWIVRNNYDDGAKFYRQTDSVKWTWGPILPKEKRTISVTLEPPEDFAGNHSLNLSAVEGTTVNEKERLEFYFPQDPYAIPEVIARLGGNSEKISFGEVQQAITWWVKQTEVPNTGGKKIDFETLQEIISIWANDKTV